MKNISVTAVLIATIRVVLSSFFFFLIFSSFLSNVVFGQSPGWIWAKSFGGSASGSNVMNTGSSCDPSGNIYLTGYFDGTIDFDPGTGSLNLTSSGGDDIFITKIDATGNFTWARKIGGVANDQGVSIATDAAGNIYATGIFADTVDFDPGSGSFNLVSAGSYDVFIAKLDSSGNLIWAKRFGAASDDRGYSIAISTSANVFTTGRFQATVDFNPDSVGIFSLTSAGLSDVFISALDSSGSFLWAKKMGGPGYDFGNTIAIDTTGNVYCAGFFNLTADFNPDSLGIFNLTSHGGDDIFISKLDASGNFVWAKSIGGSATEWANSIAVDASGNVYATGFFFDVVDFDPGPAVYNLTAVDYADIFISKLDASGNFSWAKSMGSAALEMEQGHAIVVDAFSNVYTTGLFNDTVDFDPGPGTHNLISAGYPDVFISKLDAGGNFIWAKSAGGNWSDIGFSITHNISGYTYVAGNFVNDPVLFDSISLFNQGTATVDIFVAKLSCATSAVLNIIACNSYMSPGGTVLWSSSGNYSDTIANTLGCDSIIHANLTIVAVDTSVTQNGASLTSNASGAFYQWLDCNNGFAPIAGAISQNYIAIANGSYAVAFTKNGCTDTTACFTISGLGIENIDASDDLDIFPNPVQDEFIVSSLRNTVEKIELYNLVGEKIFENICGKHSKEEKVDISRFPSGMYFVKVFTKNGTAILKVVKV